MTTNEIIMIGTCKICCFKDESLYECKECGLLVCVLCSEFLKNKVRMCNHCYSEVCPNCHRKMEEDVGLESCSYCETLGCIHCLAQDENLNMCCLLCSQNQTYLFNNRSQFLA